MNKNNGNFCSGIIEMAWVFRKKRNKPAVLWYMYQRYRNYNIQ